MANFGKIVSQMGNAIRPALSKVSEDKAATEQARLDAAKAAAQAQANQSAPAKNDRYSFSSVGRSLANAMQNARQGLPAQPSQAQQGASIPAAVNAMQNAGKSVQQGFGMQNVARGLSRLAANAPRMGMKKGGSVKSKELHSSGGKVGSASKRADGCAKRGKTKGKVI